MNLNAQERVEEHKAAVLLGLSTRPAGGFHLRGIAETLPASRTVFEVIVKSARVLPSLLHHPPGPGCPPQTPGAFLYELFAD